VQSVATAQGFLNYKSSALACWVVASLRVTMPPQDLT
jgi:hypothetical protein